MKNILILTFLLFPTLISANTGEYCSQGKWRHMMGFGHGFGMIFWIILIIICAGFFYLFQNKNISNTSNDETPLDILNKRYAKGEITKEDFEEMKKNLNK